MLLEQTIATPWNRVNYIPLTIVKMVPLSSMLYTTLWYAFSSEVRPKLMTASHIANQSLRRYWEMISRSSFGFTREQIAPAYLHDLA